MLLPRFLLVLSVHSNNSRATPLVRAALVTRELRITASAQQHFEITGNIFDPLEVWYKTKRVIAACLDIGRTQTRELVGLAIVTSEKESVAWHMQENEIVAHGKVGQANESVPTSATMGAWLVWNLTGVELRDATVDFGRTRARAPFDAEIPVVAVLDTARALQGARDLDAIETERVVLGAASWGWNALS